MSNKQDEIERLQRLRDRQLDARDPQTHQKNIQRIISQKRGSNAAKRITFKDVIDAIPYKWRGVTLGAALGIAIWIILTVLVAAAWIDLAGLAAIAILAIAGFIFGQAFDTREELKDLVK